MSNNYTKASFLLLVQPDEAELLQLAKDASDMLENHDDDALGRREAFDGLGPAFAAAFPPTDDDPFGSFLALFDDADFPIFSCRIDVDDTPDEAGKIQVFFHGDQVSVDAVALLIFAACKSALPCGFEYALDCDRLRPGEFGGGYAAITAAGVSFGNSARQLERALERDQEEGVDGFVLTTRHPEYGLSFWNNDTGFGRLRDATVFTEAEAATFDKPIAADEPEWLAMPAPLT